MKSSKSIFLTSKLVALLFTCLFIFPNCKKEDKCDGKTCLNGGQRDQYCDCQCLPGYTGSKCETESTPLFISVKEVIITKFPATKDNGFTWDSFNNNKEPDIYVKIYYYEDKNNPVEKVVTKVVNNVDYTKQYTFVGNDIKLNLSLDNPSQRHRISLYDDDLPLAEIPDFIGAINFFPYEKGNGYPDTLTLENSTVAFKLVVDYEY